MSLDFSKKLRRYTSSRVSKKKDEIEDIVYSLGSINKVFAYITQSTIDNPNICIYNGRVVIFSISTKTQIDSPELGNAKSLEDYKKFEQRIPKNKLTGKARLRMKEFIYDYEELLQLDVSYIQRNCLKKVLFFPVRLEHMKIYEDGTWDVGRHAVFLFVEPQKRKAYYVDSNSYKWKSNIAFVELGQSGLTRLDTSRYITQKLEYLLEHKLVGMKIKVNILDIIGPQRITSDHNCRYWSILLIELLSKFMGTSNFTPELVIERLKQKYNTKRKLDHLIGRYISYINSLVKNKRFWDSVKS